MSVEPGSARLRALTEGVDLRGMSVDAVDGGLGKVDDVLTEGGEQLLVVDTGLWILSKPVTVPMSAVERVDIEERQILLNLTKDEVKHGVEGERSEEPAPAPETRFSSAATPAAPSEQPPPQAEEQTETPSFAAAPPEPEAEPEPAEIPFSPAPHPETETPETPSFTASQPEPEAETETPETPSFTAPQPEPEGESETPSFAASPFTAPPPPAEEKREEPQRETPKRETRTTSAKKREKPKSSASASTTQQRRRSGASTTERKTTRSRSGGTTQKRASSGTKALPIARYDELTAAEVLERLPALTQQELGKVERHERRTAERQTVLRRIESLREDQPWRGYDGQNVADIKKRLSRVDGDRARAVRDYERRHRDRAGVMDAVRRKLAES